MRAQSNIHDTDLLLVRARPVDVDDLSYRAVRKSRLTHSAAWAGPYGVSWCIRLKAERLTFGRTAVILLLDTMYSNLQNGLVLYYEVSSR